MLTTPDLRTDMIAKRRNTMSSRSTTTTTSSNKNGKRVASLHDVLPILLAHHLPADDVYQLSNVSKSLREHVNTLVTDDPRHYQLVCGPDFYGDKVRVRWRSSDLHHYVENDVQIRDETHDYSSRVCVVQYHIGTSLLDGATHSSSSSDNELDDAAPPEPSLTWRSLEPHVIRMRDNLPATNKYNGPLWLAFVADSVRLKPVESSIETNYAKNSFNLMCKLEPLPGQPHTASPSGHKTFVVRVSWRTPFHYALGKEGSIAFLTERDRDS